MAKHHEDPENPDKIHLKDIIARIESGGHPIREKHESTPFSDKDCDSE